MYNSKEFYALAFSFSVFVSHFHIYRTICIFWIYIAELFKIEEKAVYTTWGQKNLTFPEKVVGNQV